jgi:L-aspartate oxidase
MIEIASLQSGAPVIIGGGLAGLITALRLAPMPVTLLTRDPLGFEAASAWAQGGVAAALGEDDEPCLHAEDTLQAGDGLCDPVAVKRITAAAPAAIEAMTRLGVPFSRDAEDHILLGLEAAHSRRRIVHAGGDATGREIMQALIRRALETPSINIVSGAEARRIIVKDGVVQGVLAATPTGFLFAATRRLVMATGGAGALYRNTTNPLGAIGSGLALAARAGAELVDMEFVQFHPTALDVGRDPMPLVSEAVRGEGAVLIDERGVRFMAGQGRAELEPRDIVARAVWRHMNKGRRIYLDARSTIGDRFVKRFPSIAAACQKAGVDPATTPIPIKPAAHYHMGGVAVDAFGRSSLAGLWACGEAASTGLHGANRLASNSLLEAFVMGGVVAESISSVAAGAVGRIEPFDAPPPSDAAPIRPILTRCVGIERDQTRLAHAVTELAPLAFQKGAPSDPALVGLFIALAALERQESRGAHCRTDYPQKSAAQACRRKLDLRRVKKLADETCDRVPTFAFGD